MIHSRFVFAPELNRSFTASFIRVAFFGFVFSKCGCVRAEIYVYVYVSWCKSFCRPVWLNERVHACVCVCQCVQCDNVPREKLIVVEKELITFITVTTTTTTTTTTVPVCREKSKNR